jgi:integrase
MENSRFNFTLRAIASKPTPTKKRATYHDERVPELGLMIQPTGHRSYYWFRKVRGIGTWRTIGSVGDVTIEQARNKARGFSTQAGTWKISGYQVDNPFEKRPGEPTFNEVVEDFIERHVKGHAKRPEAAEKGLRWQVDKYLSSWKNRKIGTIRRDDVMELHRKLGEPHKYTANRTLQLVRALFYWARDEKGWNGKNPAAHIKLFHEEKRKRFLQPDELARLFTALRKEPNPDLRDFVNISLWTGARRGDVLSMRWQDISLTDNRWSVPDPKSDPYTIPLTTEAVTILRDRLRRRVNDASWIFSSHGRTGHLVNLKKPWKKLLERAKINDLRIHDLRRTQGSYQAGQGTSLLVIGKSLGHKTTAATQVYAQLQLDPVREAMAAANQTMSTAMRRRPKALKAASRE